MVFGATGHDMDFSDMWSLENLPDEDLQEQWDTFRVDPPEESPRRDNDIDELPEGEDLAEEQVLDTWNPDNDHYDLRLEPRFLKRSFPGTWIDHDETGDYDPDKELRQLRGRKKRPRPMYPLCRDEADRYDSTGEDGLLVDYGEPIKPVRLMVSLSFSSDAAKTTFRDNCTRLEVKPDSIRVEFTEGYKLRKRKTNHEIEPWAATGVRELSPSSTDNLKGHPNARGCYDCLAMGLRCSLLDNEHSWPCDDCVAEDNDCLLVTPPERKTTCTHCKHLQKKKKWLVCSYSYENDHSGSCRRCREDNHFPCLSGPEPGSVRTRIRIGDDGQPYMNEAPKLANSAAIPTCVRCQTKQRVCSFTTDGTDLFCVACEMDKVMCEPLFLKQDGSKRKQDTPCTARPGTERKVVKRTSHMASARSDQPASAFPLSPPKPIPCRKATPSTVYTAPMSGTFPMEIPPPMKTTPATKTTLTTSTTAETIGTKRTITTKFSHPIVFCHTYSASEPCHFCAFAAHYPILGLPPRTIEVIEWADGRGWQELSGDEGSGSTVDTRMCENCAFKRLNIITCGDTHELKPIEGVKELDFGTALDRLTSGDIEVEEVWCSLCCNLATHECCRRREGERGKGCGLKICGWCAEELVREHGGNLQELLEAVVDEETGERPIGWRADYEFLRKDGLLMRFLLWANPE